MTDLDLGERLQSVRKRRGLTQKELARLSGVSLVLIRKLERHERSTADLEVLRELALALGVSSTELILNNGAEEAAPELLNVRYKFHDETQTKTTAVFQRLAEQRKQQATRDLDRIVEAGDRLLKFKDQIQKLPKWRIRKRAKLQRQAFNCYCYDYLFALDLWLMSQDLGPIGPPPPTWMKADIALRRQAREMRDREFKAEVADRESMKAHQKYIRKQNRPPDRRTAELWERAKMWNYKARD